MSQTPKYIHGYDPLEQQRLIEQAAYWRDDLILPDLPYQPGESLLDIGCGVGAVMAQIATAYPELDYAGVDFSPEQIAKAQYYFKSIHQKAHFQVADALALPFPDNSFDHVYMMWFLEHVSDPVAALNEARRVLKSGGSITINETDYHTLTFEPSTPEIKILLDAFIQVFNQTGRADTGANVGAWLEMVGFSGTTESELLWSFGQKNCQGKELSLSDHIEYFLGFIEPCREEMARCSLDGIAMIEQGLEDVRAANKSSSGALEIKAWRYRAYA